MRVTLADAIADLRLDGDDQDHERLLERIRPGGGDYSAAVPTPPNTRVKRSACCVAGRACR